MFSKDNRQIFHEHKDGQPGIHCDQFNAAATENHLFFHEVRGYLFFKLMYQVAKSQPYLLRYVKRVVFSECEVIHFTSSSLMHLPKIALTPSDISDVLSFDHNSRCAAAKGLIF